MGGPGADAGGHRRAARGGRAGGGAGHRARPPALAGADLAVLVIPPEAPAADVERWRTEAGEVRRLEVWSKADDWRGGSPGTGALRVSGLTGAGVEPLRRRIRELLGREGAPEAILLTSERHADALRRAAGSMERALQAFAVSTLEVASERWAWRWRHWGDHRRERLRGADRRIFRRFCIGK